MNSPNAEVTAAPNPLVAPEMSYATRALVCGLAAAALSSPASANALEPAPMSGMPVTSVAERANDQPTMVVFGDSISAEYRYSLNPNAKLPAWFVPIAEKTGQKVVRFAAGGRGYVKPDQKDCSGTVPEDDLVKSTVRLLHNADSVWIALGRNDARTCNPDGSYRYITKKELKAAADSFQDKVAEYAGEDTKIYVAAPFWGTRDREFKNKVTKAIREVTLENAKYNDNIIYVGKTPGRAINSENFLLDGIHPNAPGAEKLGNAVMAEADIK